MPSFHLPFPPLLLGEIKKNSYMHAVELKALLHPTVNSVEIYILITKEIHE